MPASMCFAGIIVDPAKILLSILSFTAAFSIIVALKKFNLSNGKKVGLIYSHLVFLFYPLILFTTHTACGMACASMCYNAADSLLNLAILSLPSTLIVSSLVGSVLIPVYYTRSNKKREIKTGWIPKFVKKISPPQKRPGVFVLDKAAPLAFSFRHLKSAIFLSVGLFDVLNKKELEAVLLHELGHIREKTSALKLSVVFFRVFSPLSLIVKFHHEGMEEEKADSFAASHQKTKKHIKAAREKIRRYGSSD